MKNQVAIHQFVKENSIIVQELAKNLYEKITKFSGSQHNENRPRISLTDCTDYLHNQVFNIYLREKSVVNDGLAKIFPDIKFEESPPELDHSGDIDYLGYVGSKAIGIQIKPITAKANFGNYSPSERMKASFNDFTSDFGGKVFIIFSLDGEIENKKVIKEISIEIERLKSLN